MNYALEDYEYIASTLIELNITNSSFLITGATGMIGSTIIKSLHYANKTYSLKNKIIAICRNKEKAFAKFDWIENASDLKIIIQNDISDTIDLGVNHIDFVIHTAGNTNSAYMITNPVETSLGIIEGTKNILNLCQSLNPKRCIFLSSMEVYGSISGDIILKEFSELGFLDLSNIRNCYPLAKRMSENLCHSYHSQYEIPIIILRLSQTFGFPVAKNENRLFGMMINNAKRGKDIILNTDGSKLNNFCYLADVITAILYTLIKGKNDNCYNVSNMNSTMTIAETAHMICHEIMNDKIKLIFDISSDKNKKYAPISRFILDTSRLTDLGWEAKTSIKEAYKRNIFF